ncbi:MBOAT family O-acyltransferase [Rubritalea tangerina]|uniref:MBOAT family O-acyltransferase n=1 Tax=Rubritalea tangerina TaxID=430798 RepID=A0ABW4ZBW9_9BACT
MLFSNWEFIFLFLPICFLGYFFLIKQRLFIGSKMWLVTASLFFYSYWDASYLPLILISLACNYAIGTGLSKSYSHRKRVNRKASLIVGICFNLGLLGYYKYSNFLIDNINLITGSNFELSEIVLPLAISFFTFQQIAYLVDSYRGETSEYNLLNYTLFVTFFPQLIAGPIVHHREMMTQFESKWNLLPKTRNILLGVLTFTIGLGKKVIIADSFAVWADAGFQSASTLNSALAWATSLSYTFQLYFDFSGYCDMAIGAALLFNIKLPINFNSPYKSLDIQDFWRRWHITLGRFLRDYIYIPLGGNQKGAIHTYNNLFLTFLIGGIWHGASWMFVIWGALHGIALVIHRIWKSLGGNMPKVLAWLVTFNFVNLTWIFFRASDLNDALSIIKAMLGLNNTIYDAHAMPTEQLAWLGTNADKIAASYPVYLITCIPQYLCISIAFYILSCRNSIELTQSISKKKVILLAIVFTVSIYITVASSSSVFLYFNF